MSKRPLTVWSPRVSTRLCWRWIRLRSCWLANGFFNAEDAETQRTPGSLCVSASSALKRTAGWHSQASDLGVRLRIVEILQDSLAVHRDVQHVVLSHDHACAFVERRIE